MNKTVRKYFIRVYIRVYCHCIRDFIINNGTRYIREEAELDSKRELIFKSLLSELESNESYIASRKEGFCKRNGLRK